MVRKGLDGLDLSADRLALLAPRLGAAGALTVKGTPEAGGWSGTTIFLSDEAGTGYVLRAEPATTGGLFAEHDLANQIHCMRYVSDNGLPAPHILFEDLGGELFDRPVYVMERIMGYVPEDDYPPFTRAGRVFDADDAKRRALSLNLIELMAKLHRLPAPEGLSLGPSLVDYLDQLAGMRSDDDTVDAELDSVRDHLIATVPKPDVPISMIWGDGRPANVILNDEFEVIGMLDWELAGTGPAELDIAWMLEMNRLRASEKKPDPIMSGFLTEAETWQHWSELVGREPAHVDWHMLFAAYRVSVFLDQNYRALIRRGEVQSDDPGITDNRTRRRMRALLA